MSLGVLSAGGRDVIAAVLAVALVAVLRGLWVMQGRVSRLEAMDEYRERVLDKDRDPEEVNPP